MKNRSNIKEEKKRPIIGLSKIPMKDMVSDVCELCPHCGEMGNQWRSSGPEDIKSCGRCKKVVEKYKVIIVVEKK